MEQKKLDRGLLKDFVTKVKNPGLKVFRVENFKLKEVDPQNHGKFYSGDSYIVVKTTKTGGCVGQAIHFWIGKDSSQDEYAAVAIYSTHLDDALGGSPVQHREIQGHEGTLFTGYFKNIDYIQGGVGSGLKEAKTRENTLYRLDMNKGRARTVHLREMSTSQLNTNHVFILDVYDPEEAVYIWRGKNTHKRDHYQANCVASDRIGTLHGGDARISICDENDGTPTAENFYKLLGYEGDPRGVPIQQKEIAEPEVKLPVQLYQVHIENGSCCSDIKLVWEKNETNKFPERTLLDPSDAFMFTTEEEIFIWQGTHSTPEEKKAAFTFGMDWGKEHGSKAPVTKVICNSEPPEFTGLFNKWHSSSVYQGKTYSQSSGIAKSNIHAPVVVSKYKRPPLMVEKRAGGKLQMFRVIRSDEDSDEYYPDDVRATLRDVLPVEEDGGFSKLYSEEGYLLLYKNSDSQAVIYWIGRDIDPVDKGRTAAAAVLLDDEHGGMPIQIRQVQGKETEDMMQFFRNEDSSKLVVFKGKDPRSKRPGSGEGKNLMLQIQGNEKKNAIAFEVDFRMGSLHSNDCFIIVNNNKKSLWFGKFCTGDERQVCEALFKRLYPHDESDTIHEGSDARWKAETFGDAEEYYVQERKPEIVVIYPEPTLYRLNLSVGWTLEEYPKVFTQYDLVPEDVMLLCTETCCFIWIGEDSLEAEVEKAFEIAEEKASESNIESIVPCKQGREPMNFKACFSRGWNDDLWAHMASESPGQSSSTKEGGKAISMSGRKDNKNYKVYPAGILKSPDCPDDVDKNNKEKHLSDEEFKAQLGKDRKEFEGLQAWKQKQLKTAAGLF